MGKPHRGCTGLRENSGQLDLTLVEAVSKVMAAQDAPNEVLTDGLEELAGVITAVDSNLVKNCTLLNSKIKALERKLASSAPAPAPPAAVALTLDSPIHNAQGKYVATLGVLIQENKIIKQENLVLLQRIDKLTADVTAHGGVLLGRHTFTSELHLTQLCVKECPKGDAFAAFVDPMLVFCFDQGYSPLAGWETLTKAMEKSGLFPVTENKAVASYNAQYPWWFSEHKEVQAGKMMASFSSKDKWQGMGGMDGRRAEIECSLESCSNAVRTAIENKLPEGSQLALLALKMFDHTLSWFSTVSKHLDTEFTRLGGGDVDSFVGNSHYHV